MNINLYIKRQVNDISNKGFIEIFKKLRRFFLERIFLCILVFPFVLIIKILRPYFLIRFGVLSSDRIGHFAANTELYLCERDSNINRPKQLYIDILSFGPSICNNQLAIMWSRIFHLWPYWIVASFIRVINFFPNSVIHIAARNTESDRDIYNLFERFDPHIAFTQEEELRGKSGLEKLGILPGQEFICLLVRDNAYLNGKEWSYHSYRDSDIQNYLLAAEELANKGYFVLRMGAKVNSAFKSNHPKVIDYATNGFRSDFMDIYLGAKCKFVISTGSGWEAIPVIFRKPIIYTNLCPVGSLALFSRNNLGLTKKYFSEAEDKFLTLSEIFNKGLGFILKTDDFKINKINLIENTPEEIRDIVLEMEERLNSTWFTSENDDILQQKFAQIYLANLIKINKHFLNTEIRGHYSLKFLRNNPEWLN